jgi:2-polyprenyl-3-methyl-5-hydroxy-6-metoxy-1,4-benzoquinol methylase
MKQESASQTDYRERIYERYALNFQDAQERFDEGESKRWGKAYRHYLRGWLPDNKEGLIADVACGGGRLLHFFNEQGYRNIWGVDISSDQVELARQVSRNVAEEDAIGFLEARREQFDLVVGLDIIEHFHKPDVLRFLDACLVALRPEGRLILQTSNSDSPWGGMHRYGDFTHEVGFNPNSLSRLMRLVGLRNIEARETGPVPLGYSLPSTVRYFVWQIIRGALKVWNIAETGNAGSGVLTRIFLISGVKK